MFSRRRLLCASALTLLPGLPIRGFAAPAADAEKAPWSETAIEAAEPVVEPLASHPFVEAVAQGDLSEEAFAWYLSQQLVRLEFAEGSIKILKRRFMAERHKALCDAWLEENENAVSWTKDLLQLTAAEIQPLKKPAPGTFPRLRFESAFDDIKAAPAVKRQMRFERDAVNRDHIAVAVASVASGCWVTHVLSEHVSRHHTLQGNTYDAWVEAMTSDEAGRRAATLLTLADELSTGEIQQVLSGMTAHFVRGCRGEADILSAAMRADVRADVRAS